MNRIVSVVVVVLGVAAGMLAPRAARSQPAPDETRLRARTLGEEGNDLFDAGHYEEALDRYDRAAKLVNVPTLGLKAARCLAKLNRLVEASERYLAVTRTTLPPDALDVHKEAVASAEQERAALLPRIPSLVVELENGGDAQVTVDGKPFARALVGVKSAVDPGRHHVEAKRDDSIDAADLTLDEGQTAMVRLRLARPPSTPLKITAPRREERGSWMSPLHAIGLGAMGLGVAGLAVGAGTAAALASLKSDLESPCGVDLKHCPPASSGDADDYNRLRIVSTAAWIAGGVFAATGIVMVAIPAPTEASKAAMTFHVVLSAGSARLLGTFD